MRLQQKARWFDGYHFKSKKSRNISKENALLASLGYSREVRRVEIGKPVDLLLQGAGWSAGAGVPVSAQLATGNWQPPPASVSDLLIGELFSQQTKLDKNVERP